MFIEHSSDIHGSLQRVVLKLVRQTFYTALVTRFGFTGQKLLLTLHFSEWYLALLSIFEFNCSHSNIALQDSEVPPSPSNDSVFAALLQVFLDLKGAGRFETVNPSLLKRTFAKQQASFWGSVQQVLDIFLDVMGHQILLALVLQESRLVLNKKSPIWIPP